MPKDPLDFITEKIDQLDKVGQTADKLRKRLEHQDPLEIASSVLDDVTKKIQQIDFSLRRTRHKRIIKRKASKP